VVLGAALAGVGHIVVIIAPEVALTAALTVASRAVLRVAF